MCSFVSPCIYLFQLTVNICHAAFTCLTQKSLVNPACPSIHLSHPSLTCLTQHVLALTCLIQHSLVSPRIHLSHPSMTCLTQHVPALTCIISHFSLSNYLSIIKQLPVSLSSIYLSHQPFNYDLFHQALFPWPTKHTQWKQKEVHFHNHWSCNLYLNCSGLSTYWLFLFDLLQRNP